jgi:hypothetical protein
MFDLKMRKLAQDIHENKMYGDSKDTLRLMGWLSECVGNVLTTEQQARLQHVIAECYECATNAPVFEEAA